MLVTNYETREKYYMFESDASKIMGDDAIIYASDEVIEKLKAHTPYTELEEPPADLYKMKEYSLVKSDIFNDLVKEEERSDLMIIPLGQRYIKYRLEGENGELSRKVKALFQKYRR